MFSGKASEPPPTRGGDILSCPNLATRASQIILRKKLVDSSPPHPPRVLRESMILFEARRASCADIGNGDHQGWLLHKTRSHSIFQSSSTWVKRWCIIKHRGFYVFKDSEITSKADTIISMKAFKVCEAPFVKSKPLWIHDAENASLSVHEHLDDIIYFISLLDEYHEFESDVSEDDSDDDDDLRVITRNIKDSSVTLDGSDKTRRRRTAISGDWRSTVNDEDLQRYMELSTKLKSLQRTLKAKEDDLEVIEREMLAALQRRRISDVDNPSQPSIPNRSLPHQNENNT
ncbi:hypothetical protein FSP39_008431 [Pinctada imbricata]|uniref:PH domain-containing protein n=1 Tax=Pinctada imbricata TaxID=66713 RepID=A0AA88Y2T7_PINIB|nr:hypothetical protein FSP39_008431 [Pinctada imbricata]